jgi:phage tail sheath gpL-like
MSIPTSLRVPIFAIEVDSSRAYQVAAVLAYKALMCGQKLAAGIAPADKIVLVNNYAHARQLFGDGSVLERMADAWFQSNKLTPLYAIALGEGSATVATGTFAITGTPTASGEIAVYIGGRRYALAVTTTSTPTTLGDALVAALTADSRALVTGVNTTGSVALTSKNKGTIANEIDVRVSYNEGERIPAGLTVTPPATGLLTGATSDTTLATAITEMGQEWFQIIVGPYTDTTNLTAIEAELAERFAYDRMLDGRYITAKAAAKADLMTFGNGRNSPHVSCMGTYKSPSTPWEWAASYAAQQAKELAIDPARPLQTLELVGILPPARADQWDPISDNNALLFDGISTYTVDQSGRCRIQRAITMYQRNDAGAEDVAYLDVCTTANLLYLRYSLRTWFQVRYPRAKLCDDDTRIAAGQQVITPKTGKAECVAWAREMEELGLVENVDDFIANLTVSRNQVDPNRLDFNLPPPLICSSFCRPPKLQKCGALRRPNIKGGFDKWEPPQTV